MNNDEIFNLSWMSDEWWSKPFLQSVSEFSQIRQDAQVDNFDLYNNGFSPLRFQDWLRLSPEDANTSFDFSKVSPALDADARLVAEGLGNDKLFILSLMALVTSVAGGRYTSVEIERLDKRLKMSIYLLNILPPGRAKTAMKDLMFRPLFDLHMEMSEEYKRWMMLREDKVPPVSRREYEEQRELLRKLIVSGNQQSLGVEMQVFESMYFDFVERRDKRVCLLNDVTVPRVMSAATNNALALVYDDVDKFVNVFGVNNPREDQTSFLISLHSGEAINVERQGSDNSYYSADPLVSMFINAQPLRLKFLLNPGFIDSGLTYRFIPMFEPDYVHEIPEDWDNKRNYFLEEISNGDRLLAEDRQNIKPVHFYSMVRSLINEVYLNPNYNKANRNTYTFSEDARKVRGVISRVYSTISTVFRHPKYAWNKRTSMVSKLHEMTDKFALIFQIMSDYAPDRKVTDPVPGSNDIFDLRIGNKESRVVEAWAVYMGFQFSRLVFNNWVALFKKVDVVDNEIEELKKDKGKSRQQKKCSREYKLLWSYVFVELNDKPENKDLPVDQLDVPEFDGYEFTKKQLERIVSKSNGFPGYAKSRLFVKNNHLVALDDNQQRFRFVTHGFDGMPVSLEEARAFIDEQVGEMKGGDK